MTTKPTDWTDWIQITTGFEGRAIRGSYAVEDGMVKVKTPRSERAAQVEGLKPDLAGSVAVARVGEGGKSIKGVGQIAADSMRHGTQGAEEHVNHPDSIAWKSMCATDEGKQKGEKWCKRAIWGNTLPEIKHVWKTVDNLTSGAFVKMWQQRVDRYYTRYFETATN